MHRKPTADEQRTDGEWTLDYGPKEETTWSDSKNMTSCSHGEIIHWSDTLGNRPYSGDNVLM